MERTTTLWVWFSLMVFLGISINGGLSQGQQHVMKKTRSSAVVVGTVYCDTCFNGAFSKSPNHLIPGALVAVECIDENSKPSFRQEVKTDARGEFKVKLPFSVSKHVKKIKRCSVKLLSSSQPYCSIASSATSSSLKRLKSNHHGENTRVFSAGFFTFKPENQPEICSQKPVNPKPLLPDPSFPPPIQDPPTPSPIPNLPIVPPLPDLPLPTLPPLLPSPGGPGPRKPASLRNKKSVYLEDKKTEVLKPNFQFLPPNPLNPPSVIPPNPLIPSIPTPTLPPNPLIPSPPTLPPIPLLPSPPAAPTLPTIPTIPTLPPLPTLPPVPGVTPPSLPMPTPPSLPVPLPPIPLIPGIPPASSSFSSHHQP
ncbi:PREDICTED: WAS/WASL-interacting protein family member 3-like [Camelina sativa]|uniref:WAS/WASL-interacting protein family member 3-like n=1 Tax=Camelina sativa TaxID=90675 RepID=A0ABM0T394_CAMSA|nr:PREDICTED: WAS/WASL-interacting protein family member 3-like [Camelina sativa]